MWAIAHSIILHHFRRSHILGMALVAMVFIWSSIEQYTSEYDLQLGDLWPTRIALWATIVITITVVLQELPKEMSSRFHLILLSKPITRYDYLLGKIFGIFAFSFIYVTILVVFSYIAAVLQCEENVPLISNLCLPWLHYVMYLWLFSLTAGVAGAFLSEAFCLIGIAMVLVGSYAIGLLPALREAGQLGAGAGLLLRFVYYAVPNFQYFGPSHYESYSWVAPLYLLVYIVGYTGLILPLALSKFERLSFQ